MITRVSGGRPEGGGQPQVSRFDSVAAALTRRPLTYRLAHAFVVDLARAVQITVALALTELGLK